MPRSAISSKSVASASPSTWINLHEHHPSKVYRSGSTISGDVFITIPRNQRLNDVRIFLHGTSETDLEDYSRPYQLCCSSHAFLKVDMPIPRSTYSDSETLRAGQTYRVPLEFIIPSHLTPQACTHMKENGLIYSHHLLMPPSMGSWECDDLSPSSARITYEIVAEVILESVTETGQYESGSIMCATKLVNILPMSLESPPLDITSLDKEYKISTSKILRRSPFLKRRGQLSATAQQPMAIQLNLDGRVTTLSFVNVELRFDPTASHTEPPPVCVETARIRSTTCSDSEPMSKLSHLHDNKNTKLISRPIQRYSTSTEMITYAPNTEGWQKDSSTAETSSFTQIIRIPIQLPPKKLFLPTFHTCLISRFYTLQVNLAVGHTRIRLRTPIQICAEPRWSEHDQEIQLPSFESVMDESHRQDENDNIWQRSHPRKL